MNREQFKALLRQQGKTLRQWAEENKFPPGAVYRVISGVDRGHYGRAHEILTRAGIKSVERMVA